MARRRQRRIREPRPRISGKAQQRVIKAMKQVKKLQRSKSKLQRGIIRQGDQWAQGKNTYKNIRPFLPLEYVDRWLAVAQGGVDLVSKLDESKEDFMARVETLVKPYIIYTPYIVKHTPITEFRALKYHENAEDCVLDLPQLASPPPNTTVEGQDDEDREDEDDLDMDEDEDIDLPGVDSNVLGEVQKTTKDDIDIDIDDLEEADTPPQSKPTTTTTKPMPKAAKAKGAAAGSGSKKGVVAVVAVKSSEVSKVEKKGKGGVGSAASLLPNPAVVAAGLASVDVD